MPDFKVSTMETLLSQTFDNVEGDYAGIGHTEFWVKGSKASLLNRAAVTAINTEMVKALHKTNFQRDVEL